MGIFSNNKKVWRFKPDTGSGQSTKKWSLPQLVVNDLARVTGSHMSPIEVSADETPESYCVRDASGHQLIAKFFIAQDGVIGIAIEDWLTDAAKSVVLEAIDKGFQKWSDDNNVPSKDRINKMFEHCLEPLPPVLKIPRGSRLWR